MDWPHLPSDIINDPITGASRTSPSSKKKTVDNDNKAYKPPKKSNPFDDEAPEDIYNDDGEELEIETEKGKEIVCTKACKRPEVLTLVQREKRAAKQKRKAQSKLSGQPPKKKIRTVNVNSQKTTDSDIDSGDESDGKSALREVETSDHTKSARRGPQNRSMQHFHEPVAVTETGGKK